MCLRILFSAAVITALGAPRDQGAGRAAPTWRLVDVATVGGQDASRDTDLFDLVPWHGLAGRRDGHLLLLDVRGRRVLEYDGAGHHVRTIGRAGEGPGEFQSPYSLALGPGDTVWVGDVLRQTGFPAGAGSARVIVTDTRTLGQLRVTRGGAVQARTALPTPGGSGSLVPDEVVLVRFSRTGPVADTLWTGPAPRRVPVTVRIGNSTNSTHAVELFGVSTYWDLLPDGSVVLADTTAYLLRIVSPSGMVLRTIGPGTAGRPVTQADRTAALSRLRKELRLREERQSGARLRNPPQLWEEVLKATPIGAVVQTVAGVRVDHRGRVWVGVTDARGGLERLDVYDPEGRLVGTVPGPPAMPSTLYGDGLFAFVERDDADAQRLRIYRVIE